MSKKICCFCERWASGGIEVFLHNLLLHMDLTELEADVVAATLEKNELSERLEARGVHFIELSGSLRSFPGNLRRFRRLLRQRQYDAVHLNLYQGLSLYYGRIARQAGVPVRIAHSHNAALRKSPTKGLKMLLHRFGRYCFTQDATALWACSQSSAAFLFDRREGSVAFVPNGIDTKRFEFDPRVRTALRRKLGLTDCLVLGNVGRLCPQKNQIFLMDVFAQLVKMRPESRLLLVGEGEDRRMLERRAGELGIGQQVIFYGSSRQVEQLLWAMDVFALPSLFEGLPLAAVEAQASGLPVLCARGLSAEVRITEHLEFFPLEAGAKAWAERILNMPGTDRAQGAQAVRRSGFDAGTVAQQIKEVYLTGTEQRRIGRNEDAAEDLDHRPGLQGGSLPQAVPGQHSETNL